MLSAKRTLFLLSPGPQEPSLFTGVEVTWGGGQWRRGEEAPGRAPCQRGPRALAQRVAQKTAGQAERQVGQ